MNETNNFLRNKESWLSILIAMGSIADIVRDFVGILSTSNNLTVYCL